MAVKLFENDQLVYEAAAPAPASEDSRNGQGSVQLKGELPTTWDIMYAVAEKYYQSVGSLDPPPGFITEEGYALGTWIRHLRSQYKKNSRFLTDEQFRKLDAIGMRWGGKYDRQWDEAYAELCEYHRIHNSLDIPAAYRTASGLLLGRWIRRQAGSYAKGQLRPDRIKRLERLGMVWDSYAERWQQMYRSALLFYRQNGSLCIPPKYRTDNGKDLYDWLLRQRKQYQSGKLSEEQIGLLRQIGFRFGNEAAAELRYKDTQ